MLCAGFGIRVAADTCAAIGEKRHSVRRKGYRAVSQRAARIVKWFDMRRGDGFRYSSRANGWNLTSRRPQKGLEARDVVVVWISGSTAQSMCSGLGALIEAEFDPVDWAVLPVLHSYVLWSQLEIHPHDCQTRMC